MSFGIGDQCSNQLCCRSSQHVLLPQLSEPVVFRHTHSAVPVAMRRFNHPSQSNSADFQLHNFAEKIPIHYRSGGPGSKKPAGSTVSSSHNLGTDLAGIGCDDENIVHGSRSESHSAQLKAQKNPTFFPGDRVIFVESPNAPGIPVVYRTPDERASNPDRLNLDRRRLTVCPILEGEEQLRLLNYQHNSITRIQHLSNLRRLIFLDLYDNHIEQIIGLASLKSLRVLMLGKNRIKKIENLDTLVKLDVLDLHGNQISRIENLSHLVELRVLNLAGNNISIVDNLAGLDALAELNLRRNQIQKVTDVDTLPNLQRLFLSFNDISSFEDVQCLGDCNSLSEICLDGNPIAQDPNYKQVVLRNMQQLKQLDMRRVTEEERRLAQVMARKEEERKREINRAAILKEKRRLAINNVKRQWESMQGSLTSRGEKMIRAPDLYASHLGSLPSPSNTFGGVHCQQEDDTELVSITSGKRASRPGSGHSSLTELSQESGLGRDLLNDRPHTAQRRCLDPAPPTKSSSKETILFGSNISSSELNMVAELEDDRLSMYGPLALGALDRNWGLQAAGAITTIFFKFIDFDLICKQLHKVRSRFPSTQNLIFSNTNIHSLQQINALAAVRSLEQLTIELDGNPVTKFTLWRLYTVYRLAPITLKKINGVEVSAADIHSADRLFGPVAQVITAHLPHYKLSTLVSDRCKKQAAVSTNTTNTLNITPGEEAKPRKADKGDKIHGDQLGRTALTYVPPDSRNSKDVEQKYAFTRAYLTELLKEATFCDRKRMELIRLWPSLFLSLVQSAVTQLSDSSSSYAKNSLDSMERS